MTSNTTTKSMTEILLFWTKNSKYYHKAGSFNTDLYNAILRQRLLNLNLDKNENTRN